MADTKISGLPVASALTGAEVLPLVQTGQTVKTSITSLVDYAKSGTANSVAYYSSSGQLSGTTDFVYTSAGRVGLGTASPAAKLEVISPSVILRANNTANTTTSFRLLGGAYSSNPFTMMVAASDASTNLLAIGGNTLSGEAATQISLYTASTVGAASLGTERLRIRSDGNIQTINSPKVLLGTTFTGTGSTTLSVLTSASTDVTYNPAIAVTSLAGGVSQGGYIGSRTVAGNQLQGLYVSSQQTLTLWGDATGDGGTVLDVVYGSAPVANTDTASIMRVTQTAGVPSVVISPSASGVSPLYRLDVRSSDGTTYASTSLGQQIGLTNTSTTNGTYSGITLTATGSSTAAVATINVVHVAAGSGDLTFGTRNGGTYAEKTRITSDGKALIGTSTSKTLANSLAPILQVEEANTSLGASLGTNRNDTNASYLNFSKSRGTAVGSVTAAQVGDNLGGIRFEGAEGTGFKIGAEILATTEVGPINTTSMPSKLTFATTPTGSVTPVTRLTIGSTGNATFTGNVTATSFSGSAASLTSLPADQLTGTLAFNAVQVDSTTSTSSPGVSTVGFRGVPVNSQTTTYTLAYSDSGKCISTNSNVNIPAYGGTSFAVGTTVVVFNNSGASISITISSPDTLRLAGTATIGTRTLAQYGVATLVQVAAGVWVCSGMGVT